jgi:hypothetical protein
MGQSTALPANAGPHRSLGREVANLFRFSRRGILVHTMTRYLALLRGINVGGRNKVPMDYSLGS